MGPKRKGGGGQDAKAQGTRGRKTRKAGHNEDATRGEKGKRRKKKTQQQPQTGQPQPGGGRTSKERTNNGQSQVQAHQNAPERPARWTRPSRARTRTHARDPGVASSDPKGAVSASTRNSPGALAESPVARRTVRETGRAKPHTPNHRSARSPRAKPEGPARDNPIEDPERVQRGARPEPLPRQGPAAGTMSPVLGRPPRATRSHPVKPVATAPGVGEGTTATGKPTGAPRATGQDEERRPNTGPRGTPERHAAGHNHGTRTGAKPQWPPGAANPGSAHNTRRTAARDKVPSTAGSPRPHPPHPQPVGSGPRPHARADERSGVGERPSLDAPHPGKRRPPPGTLMPPPQRARARAVGLVTGPLLAPPAPTASG